MKRKVILFISQASMDDTSYVGRHYISKALSEKYTICFIEREPSLLVFKNLQNLKHVIKKIYRTVRRQSNLISFTPFFKIPLERYSVLVSNFNQLKLYYEIQYFLKRNNFCPFMILSAMHNSSLLFRKFKKIYSGYLVYDDILGYEWNGNKKIVEIEENKTVANSKTVFVCSKGLEEKFNLISENVKYLPHAVDTELFNIKNKNDSLNKSKTDRAKILFFGKLRKVQVDYKLLKNIIEKNDNIDFVFVGINFDFNFNEIKSTNYYFWGERHFTELPSIINSVDGIIVPYNIDNYTNRINSIKVLQALSCGQRVFITPFNKEINEMKEYLYVFSDLNEFQLQLAKSVYESEEIVDKRIEFAKRNNWSSRASIILDEYENWNNKR